MYKSSLVCAFCLIFCFISLTISAKPFLAVGNYETNSGQFPLLALQNANEDWIYPSSIQNRPKTIPSRFVHSTCKKSYCFAIGYYFSNKNFWQPLLAHSQNYGQDWDIPEFSYIRNVVK